MPPHLLIPLPQKGRGKWGEGEASPSASIYLQVNPWDTILKQSSSPLVKVALKYESLECFSHPGHTILALDFVVELRRLAKTSLKTSTLL
jgi:hypothetical protein